MGSRPVYPVQLMALATLQHQHCVPHSIHQACCDHARDGRPLLALRLPPSVQALRMSGFRYGGSRRGVRRSKSPACPALPEHCRRSTKSVCNHTPALALPVSTRGSCILHWEGVTGRSLYCHRIVLSLLLFLVGTEEPPSAATRQATNGWRLQHIIYIVLAGEVVCAEGRGYVDGVWALRWGGLQVHAMQRCEQQVRQAVEESSMGTRTRGIVGPQVSSRRRKKEDGTTQQLLRPTDNMHVA